LTVATLAAVQFVCTAKTTVKATQRAMVVAAGDNDASRIQRLKELVNKQGQLRSHIPTCLVLLLPEVQSAKHL
jgi:hypothetical protein